MPATISLRIGTYFFMQSQRRDELLVMLERYQETIKEVAFFTGFTHPAVPLPTLRERAAVLADFIPRCQALGLSTGINHLATIGHLDENLENSLREPWQHLVDLDGSVSLSCYCAVDPSMRAYITESYQALAQAKPEFLWVDDDVRMESHPPAIKFACF